MIFKQWKVFVQWMPEYAGHKLAMIQETEKGQRLLTKIEMTDVPRHGSVTEQAIPMEQVEDFLQACLDAAWEIGLRPADFKDHTNELTAVRYHLEDMRKLAKVIS